MAQQSVSLPGPLQTQCFPFFPSTQTVKFTFLLSFLPSFLPSSLNLFISHHFLPISQSTFTSQSHPLPPISVPTPEAGLFGVVDLKGIICKIKPRFCFFSRAADGFNVVLASSGNRICEISESSIPKD